jgi:hypothetical protein
MKMPTQFDIYASKSWDKDALVQPESARWHLEDGEPTGLRLGGAPWRLTPIFCCLTITA